MRTPYILTIPRLAEMALWHDYPWTFALDIIAAEALGAIGVDINAPVYGSVDLAFAE